VFFTFFSFNLIWWLFCTFLHMFPTRMKDISLLRGIAFSKKSHFLEFLSWKAVYFCNVIRRISDYVALDHLKFLLVDAEWPSLILLTSWRIANGRCSEEEKKVGTHVYLHQGGLDNSDEGVCLFVRVSSGVSLFVRFTTCPPRAPSFSLSRSRTRFCKLDVRTIFIPQHDFCQQPCSALLNVFGFFFLLSTVLASVQQPIFINLWSA